MNLDDDVTTARALATLVRDSQSDPPTADDRRRMKTARAEARAPVGHTSGDSKASIRNDAFRQEIGTNIRSVSPLLLSFVASLGISLDELVDRLMPSQGWPRSAGISKSASERFGRDRDIPRYFLINTASGLHKAFRMRNSDHSVNFLRSGDDWANAQIIGHSLEVEMLLGPVKFQTLFGALRIELETRLPETLMIACVGRMIGDVIDHASLRGRDWPVTGVVDSHSPPLGQTLVVATGSTGYRMPWVR